MSDHPKHHCGICGVFGDKQAAELAYYALYALQHRGQESAGIVSCEKGDFHLHRGMGLAANVFTAESLRSLPGRMAIGHNRYSTTGSSVLSNAQPLVVNCAKGIMAIAHNGNLTNAAQLRKEMEARGFIFQTTVDSEVILCLLAQPSATLKSVCQRIQGAYSLVIMTQNEMVGVRDPWGFRPLAIGRKGKSWILASETCALDLLGARFYRDVEPGEAVTITKHGLKSERLFPARHRQAFCVFEYVYFARPDSLFGGKSVYEARLEVGRQLAREHPREADLVVPVPDSGTSAALGYAQEMGLPYDMAFVRNHYVGRSFLQPTQLGRAVAAQIKLNLIARRVRGKRVVLIDDSVVRGTTCLPRIKMLRKAGVKKIDLLVSCPPHRFPCSYGVDFPERRQLIAAKYRSVKTIAKKLGVDSLGYLSQAGMAKAIGLPEKSFCMACFDGNYPTPVYESGAV